MSYRPYFQAGKGHKNRLDFLGISRSIEDGKHERFQKETGIPKMTSHSPTEIQEELK